jgi:SAM-dependent methyltransferase
MIRYQFCPICKGTAIAPAIRVIDHSVSGETFPIFECSDCTARFTQDVPEENAIQPYYQFNDYISHTDTRKGLVNKLYHQVRKITLSSKKKLVEKFSNRSTGTLLDYGCGTGAFLNEMKQAGWHVIGLELYHLNLDTPGKLDTLPADDIDVITLWHVLEHVHTLHETMAQLKRVLNKDGLILIAVPNYTSGDAKHYQSAWAAWDVPRHLYHFSPASMEKLFALQGFQLEKTIPMWFDSFYVSMLSEKYKTGKTSLVNAFLNGLRSNASAFNNTSLCSSLIYVGRKI